MQQHASFSETCLAPVPPSMMEYDEEGHGDLTLEGAAHLALRLGDEIGRCGATPCQQAKLPVRLMVLTGNREIARERLRLYKEEGRALAQFQIGPESSHERIAGAHSATLRALIKDLDRPDPEDVAQEGLDAAAAAPRQRRLFG